MIAQASNFNDYLKQYLSNRGWNIVRLSLPELSSAQVLCIDHRFGRHFDIVSNECVIRGDAIAALMRLDSGSTSIKQELGGLDYYLASAQLAQLLYLTQVARVTINPLDHEMICPGYFYIPRLYELMKDFGIETPAWYFNRLSNQKKCHQQPIRSFLKPYDLTKTHRQTYAYIDRYNGDWIFCLHILGALYFNHAVSVQLPPSYWQEKMISFCQRIRLDIGEIVVMNSGQQWLVYAVSRQPDWEGRWRSLWPVISGQISDKLSEHWCTQLPNHQETFINPQDLPFLDIASTAEAKQTN